MYEGLDVSWVGIGNMTTEKHGKTISGRACLEVLYYSDGLEYLRILD